MDATPVIRPVAAWLSTKIGSIVSPGRVLSQARRLSGCDYSVRRNIGDEVGGEPWNSNPPQVNLCFVGLMN